MKHRILFVGLVILLNCSCNRKQPGDIARFDTDPGNESGLEIPVSVDLDEISYLPDSALCLYEVSGHSRKEIPFQVEPGYPARLHWVIIPSNGKKQYVLSKANHDSPVFAKAEINDGALTLSKGENNLLRYVFKTVYPPAGMDTSYKRSGFIHPLWSPGGKVLTRIQPPDHLHHYGIWNPWTHVEYEGDTIDFWNINSRQGTVRFAGFTSVEEGSIYAGFTAMHEHVILKDGEVAINELHSVKVYPRQTGNDYFIVDFSFLMNCANDKPVKLLEYRYAGLGWRTTEKWNNKNSMVLTSEGKTRKEADGSKAKWCIVQGELDDEYAGVVMMSYPSNYNHPEPLRIWPENQYERGDMFANFCPTKDMNWLLEPGKKYVLNYRFLVFNGKTDSVKAEKAWQNYADPPEIRITKYLK